MKLRVIVACCYFVSTAALSNENSKLTVRIEPQKARDDLAKWRWRTDAAKVAPKWYFSGEIAVGVPDGEVIIEGDQPSPSSCIKPAEKRKDIRPDKPHTEILTYSGC